MSGCCGFISRHSLVWEILVPTDLGSSNELIHSLLHSFIQSLPHGPRASALQAPAAWIQSSLSQHCPNLLPEPSQRSSCFLWERGQYAVSDGACEAERENHTPLSPCPLSWFLQLLSCDNKNKNCDVVYKGPGLKKALFLQAIGQ